MGCGCSKDGVAVGHPVQVGSSEQYRGLLASVTVEPDEAKRQLRSQRDASILKAGGMMQAGNYQGAIEELTATLKLFPDSARAHLDRGVCYHHQKALDAAIADLTHALELEREMYDAYTHRARVYIEQGRFVEAIADCKDAVAINRENAEAFTLRQEAEDQLEQAEHNDTLGDVFSTPTRAERKICAVCMDQDRGCRLHPCMHAALCIDCANQLKERSFRCPICDGPIEKIEPGAFMDTFSYGDETTLNDMLAAAAEAMAGLSPCPSPSYSATSPLPTDHWLGSPAGTRRPSLLGMGASSPVVQLQPVGSIFAREAAGLSRYQVLREGLSEEDEEEAHMPAEEPHLIDTTPVLGSPDRGGDASAREDGEGLDSPEGGSEDGEELAPLYRGNPESSVLDDNFISFAMDGPRHHHQPGAPSATLLRVTEAGASADSAGSWGSRS